MGKKYACQVCRIEPENNIHLILEVFSEYTDLDIVIIGNWTNSDYKRGLKKIYECFENIHLLDPIYEQRILNQIRSNCYIYIHGNSAGLTNSSLVEAMYLGLPIFSYAVRYNRETTENKAKYFNNKEELIALLKNCDEKNLAIIARYMKKIALKNYTWEKISNQYSLLF
ncbi:MAG: glycosyltransferase [Bacteroidales bacterium]